MITIIVPTYCEQDNLAALIAAVDQVMNPRQPGADQGYEMLIVDDNSPDQSVAEVERLRKQYPIRIIQPTGRERDLSLSVIDGIVDAKGDLIVVMDADLSHPPSAIPEMLKILRRDTTRFVVGSRYVAGGSFDRDWSLWRFLNSHIATWLARPLTTCSDPMSGFFAFHKDQIEVGNLQPIGYKIGLELVVRGNFSGVDEVAIEFRDRQVGLSKMNAAQQLRYLMHLRRLYFHRFRGWAEFFHYGVVGASGFVVDVSLFYLLQFLGIDHQLARAISFWPAVSWNWALNRRLTFGERIRRPKARQWLEFVMTSLVGFTMNWGIYYLLTSEVDFFNHFRILALIAGIVGASLFNFAASTFYVYSEKRG